MDIIYTLIEPLSQFSFLGITGDRYFNALVIFLLVFFLLKLGKTMFLTRLRTLAQKTSTKLDDKIVDIIAGLSNFFLLWAALYIIDLLILSFGGFISQSIAGVFIILAIYEAVKIAGKIVSFAFSQSVNDETTLHAITLVVKVVLWLIGILLILSNLGFDVSTLAASMGIGGIAIALAAQNILSDLFASFSLFFDKPFRIGDHIVLGTDSGTVKKIGLKSTRIQTLQGEELIVSNQELVSTRVQNYKKMHKRRVDFGIGLVYGTPVEKLKKAKAIIQEIIDVHENTEFMRAHFASFGDFSLNFKISYRVKTGDIEDYLDTQEDINLAIAEAFEKEGLEMAFPTQTLYINKES